MRLDCSRVIEALCDERSLRIAPTAHLVEGWEERAESPQRVLDGAGWKPVAAVTAAERKDQDSQETGAAHLRSRSIRGRRSPNITPRIAMKPQNANHRPLLPKNRSNAMAKPRNTKNEASMLSRNSRTRVRR